MLVISFEEKEPSTLKNMLVKKIYGKITSKNNKYPLVKCTDFKFRNKDRIIKNILFKTSPAFSA